MSKYSQNTVDEFHDIFLLYDTVGDELVDISYIGQVLRSCGFNPTQGYVRKIIKDLKSRGEISFEEFLPIINSCEQHCKEFGYKGTAECIIDCFKHFDRENCGLIPVATIRHALMNLGDKLNLEEFDSIVGSFVNQKGLINYEEFVKSVLSQ